MPNIRAVFFDIGGVVVHSPLVAVHGYEREKGLPKDYLNVQITRRGHNGAWQRFERGEIKDVRQFYVEFGRELSDTVSGNKWYSEYAQKQGKTASIGTLPHSVSIDGRELFGRMMRESASYDKRVLHAISRIRASQSPKYLIVALTNNFQAPYDNILSTHPDPKAELAFLGWSNGAIPQSLRDLFDDFVDSSEEGMRKPELPFFQLACKRNGVDPTEVVMLDDLGLNLKAASSLGMQTIHVPIGGSRKAIQQLEQLLNLSLLAPDDIDTPSKL